MSQKSRGNVTLWQGSAYVNSTDIDESSQRLMFVERRDGRRCTAVADAVPVALSVLIWTTAETSACASTRPSYWVCWLSDVAAKLNLV